MGGGKRKTKEDLQWGVVHTFNPITIISDNVLNKTQEKEHKRGDRVGDCNNWFAQFGEGQ